MGQTGSRFGRRSLLRGSLAFGGFALLGGCGRLPPASPGPAQVPRVGVLGEQAPDDPYLAAFRQGLRELGHTEGQSIVVECRYAYGAVDRFPALAAELIDLNVDALVVGGTTAAQAAKAQTATLPIVFTLVGDPEGAGLVASLSHPGGNVTGLSIFGSNLSGKHLELLKAMVPELSRLGVLYNAASPVPAGTALSELREAAPALAVEVHSVGVRQPDELVSAFGELTAWGAGALLPVSDPLFGSVLTQLAQLAAQHRLPSIYLSRRFAEVGGLMVYGPSFADNWRRAATYVDKILRGAKPADLPVERPTKFDLIVNLQTARELALTVPQSVLLQATEVIQ